MSEKRRDNKNRILNNGESQRSDGRYRFKYLDKNGKERNVYSWRLDHNDPTPKGRKKDLSLREKEKQVERDMLDEIVPMGGNYTVLSLCERYISLRVGVRHSTTSGYKTVLNVLRKDSFGKRRIENVKTSDAKAWLVKLQQVDGKGYSSIHTIRGVVKPAFEMAEKDDLIRKNPFDFKLVSVIVNDSVRRDAITGKQERNLLKFIKEDRHYCRYYDGIYILLNSGLRISEFCGLTLDDVDFDEMYIRVDHQLRREAGIGYFIEKPKTEDGNRFVPMTEEVAECFRNIIRNRVKPKKEPVIDGYSGFLCLDKNDMPMVANHWEKYLQFIRNKYNRIYKEEMPLVTPHVCRHTFCSKMARAGMNPKTLQYIMGHADISVTMNVYTHIGSDDAKKEMQRVTGGIAEWYED